jgi:hypothetical protein
MSKSGTTGNGLTPEQWREAIDGLSSPDKIDGRKHDRFANPYAGFAEAAARVAASPATP